MEVALPTKSNSIRLDELVSKGIMNRRSCSSISQHGDGLRPRDLPLNDDKMQDGRASTLSRSKWATYFPRRRIWYELAMTPGHDLLQHSLLGIERRKRVWSPDQPCLWRTRQWMSGLRLCICAYSSTGKLGVSCVRRKHYSRKPCRSASTCRTAELHTSRQNI